MCIRDRYKTLERPVSTRGSECWVLMKIDEQRLAVFEGKILRRTYGPIQHILEKEK